ncbi:MAG: 4Fe-4S binding protein [Bacteroidales bacterium]|jgi:uncharacterized protein with FMN-binding domain|nr:4Fe-4S binding protein [Bacteroidales bacterium]
MKKVLKILAVIAIAVLLILLNHYRKTKTEIEKLDNILVENGEKIAKNSDNSLIFNINASEITGYGGETPLRIEVDKNGKISSVQLLDNNETPAFVKRLIDKGFFNSWNGMTIEDAVNSDVDAISGSTMTTSAVIKTLKSDLKRRIEEGQFIAQISTEKIQWLSWVKNVASLLVLLFGLASFLLPSKFRKYRYILLGLSVIVLGFWQGRYLSITYFFNSAVNGVHLAAWVMLIMAVLALLLPIFTKKAFYCTYICPFGALQELSGKIPVKKKLILPQKITKYLKWLQPTLFVVILGLLFTNILSDFVNFEPFAAFLLDLHLWIPMIIAGTMLVISVFLPKFWCKYLCPTGFLLEWVR